MQNNKLTFDGNAYRIELSSGVVYEGSTTNLIAHFAVDTITICDRATKLHIPIMSSRANILEIDGEVKTFEQAQTTIEDALSSAGGASSADKVSYDNSTSGLQSTTVQDAIDEVGANLGGLETKTAGLIDKAELANVQAKNTAFSNIVSGLSATNTQDAIDEEERQIKDLIGGTKKTAIASEYFSGPQKYGFWILNINAEISDRGAHAEVGSKMTIYCDDIADGTYTIWFANKNKSLGAQTNITFLNHICEITTPSTAAIYYRVLGMAGITANSICYTIENVSGRIPTLESNMIEAVASADLKNVLDYSASKCVKRLVDYKRGVNDSCPRINFLMYTDFNESTYTGRNQGKNTNYEVLNDTLKWFNDKSIADNISAVLCNGDMVTSIPSFSSKADFKWTCDYLVGLVNTTQKPFIFVQGNHDTAEDYYWAYDESTRPTKEEVREWLYTPLMTRLKAVVGASNVHEPTDSNAWYYYVDLLNITDAHGKTTNARIFAMNEYDFPRIKRADGKLKYTICDANGAIGETQLGFNSYYSKTQLEFLINALKTTPQDTLFVTMNHINSDQSNLQDNGQCKGSIGGSKEAFNAIISAWRNNQSGSVSVGALTDKDGAIVSGYNAYTLSFDFTSLIGSHPYLHTKGHEHNTSVEEHSEMGGAYIFQGLCGEAEGSPLHIKQSDSITRYGVDIVSIKNDWRMYILRFGYGFRPDSTVEDDNGFRYIDNPLSLV